MKSKLYLSLTAFAISVLTAPVATFAGTGLIGSGAGGDRLVMSSPKSDVSDANNDPGVVVPVPNSLQSYGKLIVRGTPGAGQKEGVWIGKCELLPNGIPKASSCKALEGLSTTLNKELSLPSGHYLVSYSNTTYSNLVEVKKDKVITLQLRKIKVPHYNGGIEFDVFSDLSHPVEQEKVLFVTWSAGNLQAACDSTGEKDERLRWPSASLACDVIKTGDYRSIRGAYADFTADGKVRPLIGNNRQPFFWSVVDPKDGDFVSVFPGVYGIKFKDTMTGQTDIQYGIRVD
jgi:hypothetical protein